MALPMKPKLDRHELLKALADAMEAYEKLTPEQKEAMHQKQRESWARQDMD
jgi:hypothetical protein